MTHASFRSNYRGGSNGSVQGILVFAALAPVLLFACTSESSSTSGTVVQLHGNRPPVIQSAKVIPTPVALNKTISVQVTAKDPDGDLVTFRHKWFVNGHPVLGQNGSILISQGLKRGDRLAVDLIPFDGKISGQTYRTNPVDIGNTPPEVTRIAWEPVLTRPGDRLQAKVEAVDADQDEIRYRFRWWLNNREVFEGEENSLDTSEFMRGDTIMVEVTPYDENSKGSSMLGGPIILANSPPIITSTPATTINQGRYEYPVAAVDADGDALVYALETAPPGMKIDKATGRIQWQLLKNFGATYPVKITVKDSQDGFAFQEFELRLSSP